MKELNPVEKQRRQEKLKAKKKLKEDRKIQQASTKDISKMEQEILNLTQMDQSKSLDKAGRAKKAKLEADLSRIKRTRQNLGLPSHNTAPADRVFIPKNPEKSIWYDKVFNPYGVAPPGETYQEKDQVQTTTVKRKLDEISDISDHLSDSDDSELSFNINEPRYMDLGDIEIPAGKPARDLVDFYNSLDVPEVYHLEKSNKKSTSTLVQNLEQQKQQHQHQNLPVFPIPPPGFPIPPVGFPIPPVGFMHPPNFPPLGFPPLPMPIQRAPPAITSLPVPSGPQLGYSSVAIPEPKIDRPFRDPFAHPSASVISADPTVSNVKKDKGISKMVPMVLMKKAAKKDQELEDFLNSV